MERICVSLDDKAIKLLETYENKLNTSKADVMRRALSCMETVTKATEKVPLDTIYAYIDCLAKMEHVMLDVSHWELIWSVIEDGTDEFWEEIREVGRDYRRELHSRGIRDPATAFIPPLPPKRAGGAHNRRNCSSR